MALTCRAQLLDALGDSELAVGVLRDVVTATEVRRNATAFLGWIRHGTPLHLLLQKLEKTVQSAWLGELVAATSDRPGLASFFGPVTATPHERAHAAESAVRPALSPREREVLYELARGSTYADIAANLFVSQNTVKTHVSSLYGKLAVRRRSEALAVARTFHLL